jgi:hypothetical protein
VEARFPRVERTHAAFRWPDGFSATCQQYNIGDKLPHDLTHYAVEAELRPRYGFWELLSQKAPFRTVVPTTKTRRWPAGRHEWFAALLRKHRDDMVAAEQLAELLDVAPGDVGRAQRVIDRLWPTTDRRPNATPALIGRIHQRLADLEAGWAALDTGAELVVRWPPPDQVGASAQ